MWTRTWNGNYGVQNGRASLWPWGPPSSRPHGQQRPALIQTQAGIRCPPEWDGILPCPPRCLQCPLLHAGIVPVGSSKGHLVDIDPFTNQHRALRVITYTLPVVQWSTSSLLGFWLFNPPVAKTVPMLSAKVPYVAFPDPSDPNCSLLWAPLVLVLMSPFPSCGWPIVVVPSTIRWWAPPRQRLTTHLRRRGLGNVGIETTFVSHFDQWSGLYLPKLYDFVNWKRISSGSFSS